MIQLGKEFKSLKSTYIFNEALIWCLKNAFQVELSDGSFKFVVDCPIAMWDRKVSDYLIRKKTVSQLTVKQYNGYFEKAVAWI